MIFETFEDKQKSSMKYVIEAGSPTLPIYEYRVDKDGVKSLVKTDRVENVQDRIQADADSCDINILMQRFALGDSSALDQRSGFYGDVTDLPSNYADLFNRVEECKAFFNSLPVDLKQLFDNSYEVYFATMGTKDFDDKYAEYNKRFENHEYDDTKVQDTVIKTEQLTEVER